jgi:DNA replication protein DnaC
MRNTASLPLLLKQLGLPMMYAHWEEQDAIAQKNHWTYPLYLAALSELEVASRQQKRIQRHLKESKLPQAKTLATFNFKDAKSINAAQIKALAENPSWIKQAENLILFGPSGVGKTHIASAIGHSLVAQGLRVLFTSTAMLVQHLQQARKLYKLPEALAKLAYIPLLILDDIGYVKKDELETNVLFELIAYRYETGSLIITANQPFSEWNNIFPDNMMAVSAIDRLVHHATIINISEASYRKLHAQEMAKQKKTQEDTFLKN